MYFDNPVKGDAFQYELQFLHPDNLRQYTPYKMPSIWVVESTSGDNSDALLVKSRDITPLVIWPVQYETPNTAAQDVLTISGGQWTVPGQVAWFEDDGTTSVSGSFIPGTVYIARVTLSAYSPRYTFQDLYEDAFSYTGATVTNPAVPTNANPD
ncbi:MAG: hypothetical protein LBT11_01725, partial [Treponema sp.]|nr:hypothetical protein [Treponema sp.]